MLRAIGLSSRKSVVGAGSSSFRPGLTVPETAEEIEAKQKIKVSVKLFLFVFRMFKGFRWVIFL